MDDRHKRLAAAKRKLQEYKNQRKQENAGDSSDSFTRKSNDYDVDNSKDDPLSEELELSFSTSAESVEGDGSSIPVTSIPNGVAAATAILSNTVEVESLQELNTLLPSTPENVTVAKDDDQIPQVEIVERFEVKSNEAFTQCDKEIEIIQAQNDVLDNLEKELTSLRKENSSLTHRETELLLQLETNEKLIRDLRKEVNQFKQQGNVHQQLEELQEAVAVVTKSKMNLAEQLSNEQDKNKELLNNVGTFENELESLRKENSKLWHDLNSLKAKLEEELMKNHVLEDQRRHLNVQMEILQNKHSSTELITSTSCVHENVRAESHTHSHVDEICSGNQDLGLENGHTASDNNHSSDHDHHEHDQEQCSSETHQHHHSHGNHKSGGEGSILIEMQKTLKRLEWENKTYEAELMKLSPLKNVEAICDELQLKNTALKQEVDQLEHLVIQLQGENDTIGDYIQLYQTQRLALRQHAKENDELVEALSREKNELLHKLSELNQAVEKLASQPNATVLENKIRDLIVDVNTKVHEPYTCSVCSGSRLMTV
ncbi:unnamed protein product [Allacma fusca]|uniref:Golgin subfamily A conserved domain-containing protein n=1 Tax=Allacma fusca TaxID=39272 RepID=A0A8J2NUY2_9HEXA|nr:unnamed protein product [Allacma fusca]